MFLLIILTFIPITSLANTSLATCSEHNQYPESCNSTAGCQYDNQNECRQCEQGSYCPATETQPQPCPPDTFPNSELGATSINECFASITDGCTETDGSTNHNCGWFFPNSTPKCWNSNGEYITSYHKDPSDNKCYRNTLNCSVFPNKRGCDPSNDYPSTCGIRGSGTWNGSTWILDCYCNCDVFDDHPNGLPEYLCHGKQHLHFSSAQRLDATINFDDVTVAEQYECNSCTAGYYVSKVFTHNESGIPTNCQAFGTSNYVICGCTETSTGHYAPGCTWDANLSSNTSPCTQQACVFGKTTSDPRATSAEACKYTDQTKFCDAKGCFQLNSTELQEWGLINP